MATTSINNNHKNRHRVIDLVKGLKVVKVVKVVLIEDLDRDIPNSSSTTTIRINSSNNAINVKVEELLWASITRTIRNTMTTRTMRTITRITMMIIMMMTMISMKTTMIMRKRKDRLLIPISQRKQDLREIRTLCRIFVMIDEETQQMPTANRLRIKVTAMGHRVLNNSNNQADDVL